MLADWFVGLKSKRASRLGKGVSIFMRILWRDLKFGAYKRYGEGEYEKGRF